LVYRGHIILGYALCLSPVLIPDIREHIEYLFNPISLGFILITIYFFSLFPDLDEPHAYLSKRFPWNIVSIPLSTIVTHRGITHTFLFSIVFPALLAIGLYSFGLLYKYNYLVIISWLAYISHLVGDSLTKSGVKWFYPFSKKSYHFLPKKLTFKTGSFVEDIITVLLLFVVIDELAIIITHFHY